MKTWKSRRTVCRRLANGRFAKKQKCRQYRRTRVRAKAWSLFAFLLCLPLLSGCTWLKKNHTVCVDGHCVSYKAPTNAPAASTSSTNAPQR